MRVRHVNRQEDLYLEDYSSYWALLERPFKCTCFCLERPEMTAIIQNNSIGKVREPFSCCDPLYHLINNKNEVRFKICANCCQCGLICRNSCGRCAEVDFPIYPGNSDTFSNENSVGSIKKVFSGMQELVSDATNFKIQFPQNATPEEKLLLISTTLMIDFRHFEDTPGENSQQQ